VIGIDAGFQDTGDAIVEHIRTVYGTDTVEHVVSTHPDNNHISGLRSVLSQLNVQNLWMHVPEYHARNMMDYFRDPRWTIDGLTDGLRQAYPMVTEIRDMALPSRRSTNRPFRCGR
jgi:beta-lactamase superfamily II metal-dependent hydrolase